MNNQTKPRVGFIGLGVMGGRMVANLQKAGFRTVINDIRRAAGERHLAAGAEWAETPREIAMRCDVICTCLPGPSQVEAVARGPNGLLEGIRSGAAVFEMSTNSPKLAKELGRAFAARGAHFLDAPISGGAIGAERGRLAIWVGGEKSVFERCAPILRAMGDRPVHVGPVGAGLTTKLVNNCASQSIYPLLAEIFAFGVKAGVEPLGLWEAIRQGAVGSRRTFDGLIDEFLPGQYDPPHAALRIFFKDMTLATELARELGVPMRFANLALADYTEALNRGWAERDGRSVMLLPQERAGIEIAVEPQAIREVIRRDPPAPSDTKHGGSSQT